VHYHFVDPVEVYRAPLTDSSYTSHRDWGDQVMVWSGMASRQPDRSFETFSPARDTTQQRWKLYLPVDAVIDSEDHVLLDGIMYEVDGKPGLWQFGILRHISAQIWAVKH